MNSVRFPRKRNSIASTYVDDTPSRSSGWIHVKGGRIHVQGGRIHVKGGKGKWGALEYHHLHFLHFAEHVGVNI